MIVRAQTPKGLSWAGRLVVFGAAVFLLPLAPSWGQKNGADTTAAEVIPVIDFDEYIVPTSRLFRPSMNPQSRLPRSENVWSVRGF